jgi:nucleotidyltransferase substrate binding protein (TIGR01987 family)
MSATKLVSSGVRIYLRNNLEIISKLAVREGGIAAFPKQALSAAHALRVIDDEELWLAMLDARNLTNHTYKRDLADAIYLDIRDRFSAALSAGIEAARLFAAKRQGAP